MVFYLNLPPHYYITNHQTCWPLSVWDSALEAANTHWVGAQRTLSRAESSIPHQILVELVFCRAVEGVWVNVDSLPCHQRDPLSAHVILSAAIPLLPQLPSPMHCLPNTRWAQTLMRLWVGLSHDLPHRWWICIDAGKYTLPTSGKCNANENSLTEECSFYVLFAWEYEWGGPRPVVGSHSPRSGSSALLTQEMIVLVGSIASTSTLSPWNCYIWLGHSRWIKITMRECAEME